MPPDRPEIAELREAADIMPVIGGVVRETKPYFEFTCRQCGERARNTYCEPHYTDMLERRLCWTCNYWLDFERRLEREHASLTIIDGHTYGPGNRTTGSFRGMAGRRFDIEYIEPSVYAGQRITTFDLWSGSTLPEVLRVRFVDTARFLGGAERANVSGITCWDASDHRAEPYPLPSSLARIQKDRPNADR